MLATIALALALVVGLAVATWAFRHRPQGEPQAVEFSGAAMSPDMLDSRLIALGEATHGSSQFQALRTRLVEATVDHDFRTVVLESDFGSAQVANRYVLHGEGTAQEAAHALDYLIYDTQESADLLTWMREWNQGRPPQDRLHFYGMDLARFEHGSTLVLDYLDHTDPALATEARDGLGEISNDIIFDADTAGLQRMATGWGTVAGAMADNRDALVAASSEEEYAIAQRAAHSMGRAGAIRIDPETYAEDREQGMVENLSWILAHEESQGREHALLFGHNGHLEKSSGSFAWNPGYVAVGEQMHRELGEDYAVIGTSYTRARFLTDRDETDQTLTQGTVARSQMRGMFTGTTVGYLEIDRATPANREVLDHTVTMGSTGYPFMAYQRLVPMFNTVPVVPSQEYDALIHLEQVDAATLLPAP